MTAVKASTRISEIKRAVQGRWPDVFRRLAPSLSESLDAGSSNHVSCPLPSHDDRNPSFRIDKPDEGRAVCCCGSYDGWQLLEQINDWDFDEAIKQVGDYLGVPFNGKPKSKSSIDILKTVANQKRVSPNSLKRYGASATKDAVLMPMYGPDRKRCSTFILKPNGDKGRYQKNKPTGLFVPTDKAGKVRFPKAGETWQLVEGGKDSPALFDLELFAIGLPTSFLSPKFASIFSAVHVVIIPDRDLAGEQGARRTAATLDGIAASIKIAKLPAELKEKDGDDCRDILAKKDGEKLLREAIANAEEWTSLSFGLIFLRPNTQPISEAVSEVTDKLLKSKHVYGRTGQAVLIQQGNITPILEPKHLAGVLNQFAEIVVQASEDDDGTFKPLPAPYANVWLNRGTEIERLPEIRLFTRNPVYAGDYRLVAPGFDLDSGVYYDGPEVKPASSTKHLDALLQDFCFKDPADRTNYVGILLTALLVSKFIGSKPAIVFNGNQPELGKSILAQIIAIVRDGEHAETASYNANDEEFEKRLGSIVRRGSTTVIVDNAKARGRAVKIESACLERSITDPILSFRLLQTSSAIRTENSHIFCVTANTPEISRDLITRSVVVNLHHEGNPSARSFEIPDPEGYAVQYRTEILAELCGMIERWKAGGMPLASTETRFNKKGWGNIVGGILEANGEPDFLGNAGEAAEQMDATRREFAELVEVLAGHPQGVWMSHEIVELAEKKNLLSSDLGDGSKRSKATKMGILCGRYVAERFDLDGGKVATFLKKSDRNGTLYKVGIEGGDDEN